MGVVVVEISFALVGGLFVTGRPILCPAWLEPSVMKLSEMLETYIFLGNGTNKLNPF